MPLTNNSWNTSFFGAGSGYGDNWDPTKNPISIGFIPGYALQSRELLELQTILAYQTSTTNRCLFRHGQPRVDLETESLENSQSSPVTRSGFGANARLRVYKNAELFCNFTTPAIETQWIPTGFWLTFPPYLDDDGLGRLSIPIPTDMAVNSFLGFDVLIRVVAGDGAETDQFDNIYDFRDPAGREYANSQAIGAGRLVYEIVNQGTVESPVVGRVGLERNPTITSQNGDGELYSGFVPIIKKLGEDNFVFAFKFFVTVPTEV